MAYTIATTAASAVAAMLLVDIRPRLLALLGHRVECFVDTLGLDLSLAGSGSVGQHLVLCLHACSVDEVRLIAADVGDVIGLGNGALASWVVNIVATGEAVEQVGMNLAPVAELRLLLAPAGVHGGLLRPLLREVPPRLAVGA